MILQMRNLVDAGVLDRAEAEAMISGSLTPPRMEKWPTPTVCGNYNRKGASPTSGDGLATAVLKCATPTARDWRSGKASDATMERNSRPLSEQIGGSLNPTWVEWLMGWPLGWTDLKPLETDKSHCALQQRGDC
jgi:DNA (cytosine-5)-methyltransferase 1